MTRYDVYVALNTPGHSFIAEVLQIDAENEAQAIAIARIRGNSWFSYEAVEEERNERDIDED